MNNPMPVMKKSELPIEGLVKVDFLANNIVPFSRTTIYRMIADGRFPKPRKIGKATFWNVQVIREWLNAA